MSARNTLEAKRARRARRTLKKGRLDCYVDLVHWVKMRSSLTTHTAIRVILAGALKVDSHTIGVKEHQGVKFFERCVPADVAARIEIVTPEKLRDAKA